MQNCLRNLFSLLALLVFGASAAHAEDSLARVTTAQILKVAVADNGPWVIRKPDGSYTGADIDLVNMLAQDLGVRVQYVEMAFADLVPAVAHGDVDMAVAGIAITPERAKSVAFSTATGVQRINMVADRKALGADAKKAIAAPGFKIAALAQSTDAAAAKAAFPKAAVTEYESEAASLAALLNGDAQAMVATAPVPRMAAKLYDARLQRVGGQLLRTAEAFALRPDDTRLLTFVNNWIAARLTDGTIRDVGAHWFAGQSWLAAVQTDQKATAPAK